MSVSYQPCAEESAQLQVVTRVAVREVQLCLLLVLGSLSPAALAEGDCASLAVTALESLYCRVVAGGEGSGLPSLQDFRQNNSKIQSLLLKRRAAALDLEMPLAGKPTETAPKPKDRAAAHSPPNDSILPEAENYSRGSFERATIGDDLQGCSLQDAARSIRCGLLI